MNAHQAPTPTHANRNATTPPNNGQDTQPALALADTLPVVFAGSHATVTPLVPIPDTAVRVLDCLHALGYASAVIQDARTLLDRHGEDALRDVVRGAKRGEAGQLARLGEWMLQQRITPFTPVSLILAEPPPPPLGEPIQFVPIGGWSKQTHTSPAQQPVGKPRPTANANNQPIALHAGARDHVKVFGAKAALTLVVDVTRAGTPTVTIEAAAVLGGNERRYDWAKKIRFQLTTSELQLMTALLLAHLPTLNFKNHGDKWLRATRQDDKSPFAGMIQMTVGKGARGEAVIHTVAVDSTVLGETISLFLRQTAASLRLPAETMTAVLPVVAAAHGTQTVRLAGRSRCGSTKVEP